LSIAVVLIIVCAICGHLFRYSGTWQLIVNTATTIITSLRVDPHPGGQNRDAGPMQAQLDELSRAADGASRQFIAIEHL
jgi:low affinity Fe/Cu permease